MRKEIVRSRGKCVNVYAPTGIFGAILEKAEEAEKEQNNNGPKNTTKKHTTTNKKTKKKKKKTKKPQRKGNPTLRSGKVERSSFWS